jgi:hypothetical protein
MNIDSFTAGYRAAAAVAIAEAERVTKEDTMYSANGYSAGHYTGGSISTLAAVLEKEERHLKRVLAGEDPYAAYREFLTY